LGVARSRAKEKERGRERESARKKERERERERERASESVCTREEMGRRGELSDGGETEGRVGRGRGLVRA
jgi:hypothetical protein